MASTPRKTKSKGKKRTSPKGASSLENPTKRQALFVWAVSAKRYALFNIENGEPVIRKASAHGLGQLQAPYDKTKPARGIPAPRGELK
jgi:hypothetical protein